MVQHTDESRATAAPPGRWARWVALLGHREAATSLALVRVCLGLTTLWSIAAVVFSDAAPLLLLDKADGGYRAFKGSGSWLVAGLGGPTPALVSVLAGVGF